MPQANSRTRASFMKGATFFWTFSRSTVRKVSIENVEEGGKLMRAKSLEYEEVTFTTL